MSDPLAVTCPTCHAAPTKLCSRTDADPEPSDKRYKTHLEGFHTERLAASTPPITTGTADVGEPPPF